MLKRAARRRPPRTQTRQPRRPRRPTPEGYWDITHCPLQCLAFLAPLVIAYEAGMALVNQGRPAYERSDLAARQLLQWFFSLFGANAVYLPGLVLAVVLLCWHMAGRYSWRVSWRAVGVMGAESVLLAIPLLALRTVIEDPGVMAGTMGHRGSVTEELLLSIGAGIYEELVFRLIIISLLTLLLADIARMKQVPAVALAVILSSLLFSAHHYEPIGSDPWSRAQFAFRAAAGAYLAAVYVFRGFGLAVGCHAMYDVIAFLMNPQPN